jgi:putative Mg2+ transporter-C (MgtC) family protein
MAVVPTEIAIRLLIALILGAVIGSDRQRRDHPAGLRTHILVSLASATFLLISTQLPFYQHFDDDEAFRFDPSRIAAGIVMGMGFLGAGSIIRSGKGIRGLTTAASLWLVAALGMAAGAGMYLLAGLSTAIALFVLTVLRRLEKGRHRKTDHLVTILLKGTGIDRNDLLRRLGLKPADIKWVTVASHVPRQTTRMTFEVTLDSARDLDPLLGRLAEVPSVILIRTERPWISE